MADAAGGSEPIVAPYGSWQAPFPVDWLTEGAVRLIEVMVDGDDLVWLEGRPAEGGRQVVVRRSPDRSTSDVSPPDVNVRSRVHEYGGAPFLVRGDLAVISDFATGRLLRLGADGAWAPLTPQRAWRYADLEPDEPRGRLLAIREDHEPATAQRHGEWENALVAVDLADGSVTVLAEGRDFYAAPRISPDGSQVAWLQWDHPNMPWDGTELWVGRLAGDGSIEGAERLAGDASTWVGQPRWMPDGSLWFVAEPGEWAQLSRWCDGLVTAMTSVEVEFAYPEWTFGEHTFAPLSDGRVAAVGRRDSRDRLYLVGPEPGALTEVATAFTEIGSIDVQGDRAIAVAASPTSGLAIVAIDLASGVVEVIRRGGSHALDPADISVGQPVEFPTDGGRTARGILYLPHNPRFRAPDAELPPIVVTSHGGPTSAANTALSLTTQAFTSRGIAVLDVDYGGSTGYGRSYRERLEGGWGIVDVDDCVAGARWLADQGRVDGARMVVRGGSASGFTTLAALAFRHIFAGGISYFGIGDLRGFVEDTHKFESRYVYGLVGPWPEARERYEARSPSLHAEGIRAPVLVLQGEEDRVVPPSEAERIVGALRANGIPHAYILFPGEDHGFRQAASIRRAFEAELSFLGQVLGFQPADPIPPVELVRG